jgi:3-hydroxyisobutyrate dehydrogenase
MSDDDVLPTIGFIGAGTMGTPMVAALSRGGFPVLIYDVRLTAAAAAAAAAGSEAAASLAPGSWGEVRTASSLRELAAVRTAVLMLPSSVEVEATVAKAGGLLELLSPGSIVVDMSSSRPESTKALHAKAWQVGIDYVDAPVSGGLKGARERALTIMFGGTEQQLDRCRPMLEAMSARVVHAGDVGAGDTVKSLNNLLSAVGLTVASEALAIGSRLGLEPETMLEVFNNSTGRNHATETKLKQFVLSGSYASGFGLRLMAKDLQIAMELADMEDVVAPVGKACLQLWQEAAEQFPLDADQTVIANMPRRRHIESADLPQHAKLPTGMKG